MTPAFWQERLETTQRLIVAYEDAIFSLGTKNVQEYTLDTGQTRQVVKRPDLAELKSMLDSLYNRAAVLQTRLTGCGIVRVIP